MERILRRYPGLDCRRIDIEIQKGLWDRGIGSTAIGLPAWGLVVGCPEEAGLKPAPTPE